MHIETILKKLDSFSFPFLDYIIPREKWLKKAYYESEKLKLDVEIGFPHQWISPFLLEKIKDHLNLTNIELIISSNINSHYNEQGLQSIPGVKNIIAVASGKGGVGKSTIAANLACSLQQQGAKVGILDADIYGPNQPMMFGLSGAPQVDSEQRLIPHQAHHIQVMSMAFLIAEQDTPMIWRGPMVSSALQQLLNNTAWCDLDYLIIDLPPGTGDIQLTLAQKIPVTGAVIVTTPQDIALQDVQKAVKMFEKVRIPILGVIENMSYYECPCCHHQEFIFGQEGMNKLAKQYHINCLGQIPLQIKLREHADQGTPFVVTEKAHPIYEKFQQVAFKTAALISRQNLNKTTKFPKIVIEKG